MGYKFILRPFSRFGTKYLKNYLKPLKEEIVKSNLNMIFELYVGRMLLGSTLIFFSAFIGAYAYTTVFFDVEPLIGIASGLILGVTAFFATITMYHSYPFQIITGKRRSIEANLPFAINHMAAIASSGVPPFIIFKIMTSVPEYGEITHEAERITRNIEVFGMDLVTSMKNVAARTPSMSFREFLSGIVATTETGGDLQKYLSNSARDAMFEYRLKRERYLATLSTYADFYTAVLIAAPLFFVSILAVMALIGGSVLGLSIPVAMQLGIFIIIPLLNTAFILFIHYTQPSL